MRVHKAGLSVVREYDDLTDFVQDFEARPNQLHPEHRASEKGSYAFTHTRDLEEALRMYRTGWPGGADELIAKSEAIKRAILPNVPHHQLMHSVTGAEVDVGAYMDGVPESMLDWQTVHQDAEVVSIVVNASMMGAVSGNSAVKRAGVVAGMLAILAEMNIPTDLTVAYHSIGAHSQSASHTVLLHASQPGDEIDIDRLAFIVGHPAMFRRLIFGMREREEDPEWRRKQGVPDGYGKSANWEETRSKVSLWLPGFGGEPNSTWTDSNAAVAWVLRNLSRIGVELDHAA